MAAENAAHALKVAPMMEDGQTAAAQIQTAVNVACRAVLAGYGEIAAPLAALRSAAGPLAALTHASNPRACEFEVGGEFCERLSRQLRGIDDDRIGARPREVMDAVRQNFPAMH